MSGSCCTPAEGRRGRRNVVELGLGRRTATGTEPLPALVQIPRGSYLMGSESPDVNPGDGEGPVREVHLDPFEIGRHAVTNEEFSAFVEATGYRTGAERFGWSFVFAGFLRARRRAVAQRPSSAPWWFRIEGADWQHPEGRDTDISTRWNHPVVHVDHDDARAYCEWTGTRLPTEAEWERAARGGIEQARFAWGHELTPNGVHHCNIWQGPFPTHNTGEDGYLGTAPVESFTPNGLGLYNVAGNVWEWCADWWSADHDAGQARDPRGPHTGSQRVTRGGSYLCHDSYCNRYRVAARTRNDPDSSAGNLGFRVARNLGLRI